MEENKKKIKENFQGKKTRERRRKIGKNSSPEMKGNQRNQKTEIGGRTKKKIRKLSLLNTILDRKDKKREARKETRANLVH